MSSIRCRGARGAGRQAKLLGSCLVLLGLLPGCGTFCAAQKPQLLEAPPPSNAIANGMATDLGREPLLSHEQKLRLLRQQIKYVFVLFQENRAFDSYFGTYPGADGLFSRPASETAGFTQTIVNVDGTLGTVTPFRIPADVLDTNGKTVPLYPTDLAGINHSHVAIARKLDLDSDGVARNDQYALTEEGVTIMDGKPSGLRQRAVPLAVCRPLCSL